MLSVDPYSTVLVSRWHPTSQDKNRSRTITWGLSFFPNPSNYARGSKNSLQTPLPPKADAGIFQSPHGLLTNQNLKTSFACNHSMTC